MTAPTGEANGNSKLTAQQVEDAKSLRARGATFVDIATHFGVEETTVRRAVTGLTWRQSEPVDLVTDEQLAQRAVAKWLLARAAHAKALAEVSRLGREMGTAFTEMLHAMATIDRDVALSVVALKLSAKEPR